MLSTKAPNGSSQVWLTQTSVFSPFGFFDKEYDFLFSRHIGVMIFSLMSRIVLGVKIFFENFDGLVLSPTYKDDWENYFLWIEFVHCQISQIENSHWKHHIITNRSMCWEKVRAGVGERCTIFESLITNWIYWCREIDVFEWKTSRESISTNRGYWCGKIDIFEWSTSIESLISDRGYWCGKIMFSSNVHP